MDQRDSELLGWCMLRDSHRFFIFFFFSHTAGAQLVSIFAN